MPGRSVPKRRHRPLAATSRTPDGRAAILARAIDDAPVCVFVADSEMRYRAVNAYACDLLGYAEEELLTMRVSDIATYADAPKEYESMIASAYLQGTSRIRCKDGEELVLRYIAGEVDFDGERLFVSVGQVEFAQADGRAGDRR